MAGKIIITPEDFQAAAIKYRKQLLMIPIVGLEESLKYMTGRPGIRYKERVGTASGKAQFAPYKPSRSADFDPKIEYRDLETFFGNVVLDFEPNSAVSTLLGTGATKGDGQMKTPTALLVLALIAASLAEGTNDALFSAVRNAAGDTIFDLFNGFDTIAKNEITAGTMSADKNNLIILDDAITDQNAGKVLKQILRTIHPKLRRQKNYLYCSQDIVDAYCEWYLLTHGATPYNTSYDQLTVEGSGGKLILCPLSNKADSKFLQLTQKSNMLIGYDQMSDVESVMVKEYKPFLLTYIATMFFGCQYESVAPERICTIQLPD